MVVITRARDSVAVENGLSAAFDWIHAQRLEGALLKTAQQRSAIRQAIGS
jgi:hypothetical protein